MLEKLNYITLLLLLNIFAFGSVPAMGATVGDIFASRSNVVARLDGSLANPANTTAYPSSWTFTDVALDQSAGKVYISGTSGVNSKVVMWDSTTLAEENSSYAYVNWDYKALAVNQKSGRIYVAGGNNRVVSFAGIALNDADTSSTYTSWGFQDIAINKTSGDVYVAAWNGTDARVVRFDSDLNQLGTMVAAGQNFTSIDINQTTGDIYLTRGIRDEYSRILKAGADLSGLTYGATYPGWDFQGIAIDQSSGEIYVASAENSGHGYSRVAEFNAALTMTDSAALTGWDFKGIDVNDTSGDVYATSSDGRIRHFNTDLTGLKSSTSCGSFTGDIEIIQQIPEPTSMTLLGLGSLLLIATRRRRLRTLILIN